MSASNEALIVLAVVASLVGAVSAAAPTTATTLPASSSAGGRAKASDDVKVCQVGYLPRETKFAMVTAPPTGDVTVRRAGDGSVALTVEPGAAARDADSGDEIRPVDFSALTEPGAYYLDVPGVGASHAFAIGDDIFARPFRLAMRSFTGQRCGTRVSLAPDFPDYHYEPCHLADAQYHASTGREGTLPCTGGWHDAGDYGRYVVNSGITTGTLLVAYELNEAKLRQLNLDIPESGGAVPDVLAEIRWNLDWMLKMQDPADGGAWHKATTANFPGMVLPIDDRAPMLIVGTGREPYKTTAATAGLAAVAAAAARVYRQFDPAYADRCLSAAERAFAWAKDHPDSHFTRNPQGVSTGGYEDREARDELLWAAAELFRTTGKAEYDQYFLAHYGHWTPPLAGNSAQGWPNVRNLGMYAYALAGRPAASAAAAGKAGPNAEAVGKIRAAALAAADDIVKRIARNGYRMPLGSNEYYWGSNSVVANYAMMLLLANRLAPEPRREYADAAQDALHYLLGRNSFNTSFVTQVGSRWAMRPHHRPSAGDKNEQPWPGLLVGGPNAQRRRDAATRPVPPPARQWVDDQGDYARNENAVNWNAPLVFLLAEALPPAKTPGDGR